MAGYNLSMEPKYGNITIHENAAGLVYMRYLEPVEDDPRKFLGRVIDPTTMKVVRYDHEDAALGRCVPEAVGLPVMGWGYYGQIKKVCRRVADARKFWDSVHWGPTAPKEF